jgi:hypothetical protein
MKILKNQARRREKFTDMENDPCEGGGGKQSVKHLGSFRQGAPFLYKSLTTQPYFC